MYNCLFYEFSTGKLRMKNKDSLFQNKIRELEKQALVEYAAEQKKSKEERAKWEAEYYAKIEQCRKEQEELNCKIKEVLNKVSKTIVEIIQTSNKR